MRPYTGMIFNPQPSAQVIAHKRHQLSVWKQDLYGSTDDCSQLGLVNLAAELCGLEPTDDIQNLALQIEEDVAIIHQGVLAAICFCSPSSWIPGQRIGQRLATIHQHVADSELLVRASDRISHAMATGGPFGRHVWTITNSGDLNQHPSNKSKSIPESLNDLYFRTETQTTMSMGNGLSSLFFVRVQTCPLLTVWDNLGRDIIDSVESMSDSVLDYKNLRQVKNLLKYQ